MRGRASPDPVLTPPRIDFSTGVPRSGDYDDVYHAEAGALAQAEHVFLGGNGLPARWDGRRPFAILETGFGLGHNFLATWKAWRAWRDQGNVHDDQGGDHGATQPQTGTTPPAVRSRPPFQAALHAYLDFVAVESHPPSRDDLIRAHALSGAPVELAALLAEAWPEPLRGLHRLSFDGGRVRLTLAFGDAGELLPTLVGRFDAFYLDGFAPKRNPAMWDARLMKSLARLAASGATLATWSVARGVRDGLVAAGFEVERAEGFGRKRWMSVARFAPRAPLRTPVGRPQGPWAGRRAAVIVGAGLAGAAVARALADRGWRCTVLEGAEGPARGASGNPAGLFHGVVHGTDGIHARLHRTAALLAARHYAPLIREGQVLGAVDGLLVVQPNGGDEPERTPAPLQGYAEWLDVAQARAEAGLDRLPGPAMRYVQGGWIAPDALVRRGLNHPAIDLVTGVEVAGFQPPRHPGDDGTLTDAAGRVVARAPLIVLACGPGLLRWSRQGLIDAPTLGMSAGRVSWFASDDPGPKVPVSGHGYALRLPDGRVLCGATSRPPDDPATAEDDHRWNLQRLSRLTGLAPRTAVDGRLGWRVGCADRLPVIGALPASAFMQQVGEGSGAEPRAVPSLQAQPRHVPRVPGLFVAGGFGSRGLVWAPLAGELIASWVEGTPLPLESDLVDAIDPARALSRRVRHARPRAPQAAETQAEGAEGPEEAVGAASAPGSTAEPASP